METALVSSSPCKKTQKEKEDVLYRDYSQVCHLPCIRGYSLQGMSDSTSLISVKGRNMSTCCHKSEGVIKHTLPLKLSRRTNQLHIENQALNLGSAAKLVINSRKRKGRHTAVFHCHSLTHAVAKQRTAEQKCDDEKWDIAVLEWSTFMKV